MSADNVLPGRNHPVKRGLVSIMMPAFNAGNYIQQAIDSVLSQSYDQWELIVVDDGSADHTAEIASDYSDTRILVVRQENYGEASARNKALEFMRGEFIAFLDADDIYLPRHLEHATYFLNAHTDFQGVYSDGFYINEEGNTLQPLSKRRRGFLQGDIFEELVRASNVFGPPVCVVLRSGILWAHNLHFDPEIVIGPDWDFFTRFAEYGTFGFIKDKTCHYRLHSSSITNKMPNRNRALELAKCRMKAIKLHRFKECSPEVKSTVFYDLLVDQLCGLPDLQDQIISWSEWQDLNPKLRARLLRLMASRAIKDNRDSGHINQWLARSREIAPSDYRAGFLQYLYRLSPSLCRLLIQIRTIRHVDPYSRGPFDDLSQDYLKYRMA
jgi:glycosyltransferase involved in cell wall biosynthesis